MIFGIGTDIVSVSRIEQGLAQFGERFARRILSDTEYQGFNKSAKPAHYLAKRFAAKEACAKAMGTGFRDGLSLRHISVVNDGLGKPSLMFVGKAASYFQENNIGETHLSLADENHYAIAFVTLMRGS